MTDAPIRDEDASSAPPAFLSLKVCHPAVADAVPVLRHAAADFAAEHGADADLCGDISLAVSEAVTNAVKHSQSHTDDPVRLTAAVVGDWLEITVADRGAGFGLRESDGLGLGLPTIARLAAQLTISQEGQGTQLSMRFPLPL